MIPYILLIIVPLLFSFVAVLSYEGKHVITVGSSRRILESSSMLPVFFLMLLIILCLRDETIGRDLINYKYYYEQISALELSQIFNFEIESLYMLLNWIVSRFTNSFQFFISIIALVTVIPVAKVYCDNREHGFLKILLFINMSTFVMLFSGLRQSIAIALGVWAYEYVKNKKPWKFIFVATVALGFHHSAFIVFLLYPMYYLTLRKKHLWIIIPSIIAVFAFNKPIFAVATTLLNYISEGKYSMEIGNTGAYTTLILFIVFAIFSYIIPDEKTMDRETMGLRNYLLLAVFLQCFAPVHMLAMRFNYYFIIFIPILIPRILEHAKVMTKNSIYFVKGVMVLFFASYYLITTYTSCKTGISALDIYPYIPFWE